MTEEEIRLRLIIANLIGACGFASGVFDGLSYRDECVTMMSSLLNCKQKMDDAVFKAQKELSR